MKTKFLGKSDLGQSELRSHIWLLLSSDRIFVSIVSCDRTSPFQLKQKQLQFCLKGIFEK